VNISHDSIRQLESDGRWADAATAWRIALTQTTDATELLAIRVSLIRCLWHDGDLHDAEEEVAAASHAISQDSSAVLRGRLLLEQGRLQESRGHFRAARSRYEEARSLLSTEQSESAEALLLLARLARELGDGNEAEAALNTLDTMSLTDYQRGVVLDERGALEMARGHLDKAVVILINAADSNQAKTEYRHAYTRLLLAECYVSLSRTADAEEEIRSAQHVFRAVQDHRGNSEAFELSGRLWEGRQEYHRAVKAYHDGLEHDYRSQDVVGQARAYRHLARCYRNLGEYANAESALDDAESVLPIEHDVERASLYIEQGHLACDRSDYDEAIRRFTNAVEIISADDDVDAGQLARARRGLARALREDSQLQRAQDILEDARDTWPADADRREYDDLLDDLAEVYLDLDRFEHARSALMTSLQIGEDVGTVQSRGRTQLLLAQALFALGDRAEAQGYLAGALAALENDGAVSRNTSWRADALMQQGMFAMADGQIHKSIEAFAGALKIATRRGDTVRIARAQRQLSACYRQRGDFRRAHDYLDDAEDELREVDDRMEKEMFVLERARLDLARWQHGDVERRLNNARSFFDSRGSTVRAAVCDRLLAQLAFQNYRYTESLRLLEIARDAFEASHVSHDLDDTYDDIAEVYLQLQDLPKAEAALEDSYAIDKRLQWRTGSGRTLILKARLALLRNDVTRARQRGNDALAAFMDARDEVRIAEAYILLGDCAIAERQYHSAIEEFKKARRLEKGNGDQVGTAVCYQRLGLVYTLDGQYARAEESLDQAEDYLVGTRIVRELAPLERDRGRLAIDAHNDYVAAISHFERALRFYQEMADQYGINDIYQRLIAAHQARNDHDEAFKYMQEMGFRHASMWTMLSMELDPALSAKVSQHFAHKAYGSAVKDGFGIVENELRMLAAAADCCTTADGKPDTTVPISSVLKTWLSVDGPNRPTFAKSTGMDTFQKLATASFDFVRNPVVHQVNDLTPQQAFTSLCLANLILTLAKASG
jgi:tetratricopeptide (TPR) repeat protein